MRRASMSDGNDGQDVYDTPNRESPTSDQNDDMQQNRSRGGPEENPPRRTPVEIDTDEQLQGHHADKDQGTPDERRSD